MEGERRAIFIFNDRRLVIDDVSVAVENLFGTHPAARLAVIDFHVVDAVILRSIGKCEALASAEARYEPRPRTDDAIIKIEIVAAFFQHEGAGIMLVTPPVAHEERAMIGRNMFRGLNGNNIAELAFGLSGAQIAVKRRITQHKAHQQPLVTVLVEQTGKLKAFLDADDDRLFTEDGATGFEPEADMLKVHMVRRADHQKIEFFVGDQRLGAVIRLADRNALFLQTRQASRSGIDITDDLEILVDFMKNVAQITETESESDNSHLHELCSLFIRNSFSQKRPFLRWPFSYLR